MGYTITRERLRRELGTAFYMARRHKRKKSCVAEFEKNLPDRIDRLTDKLYSRSYTPSPSFCFIVREPKTREIFAAQFEDRIVHHLYYNMVAEMFDSLFIADSYSCRYGKGTHYGVKRMYSHIQKATKNHTQMAYVLQLDIKGYFISIDRHRLLTITMEIFDRMADRRVPGKEYLYGDVIDFDFVRWLNRIIVMANPAENCIFKSPRDRWNSLPPSKSLFKAPDGCGLPIGNLTSQLLSNVYLNVLDQYVKRELKCRHYGRYVDDLYIIDNDRKHLHHIAGNIRTFLTERLALTLNEGKTRIARTKHGCQFLGYFVRENRIYIGNRTHCRIKQRIAESRLHGLPDDTVNSYLGLFSHSRSYRLRSQLFGTLNRHGVFDNDFKKFVSFKNLKTV